GPVFAPIGVVVELPQVHELVDHPGVALEVADELAVVAALLEGGESELLIKLGRLRHLADVERVGSHLVKRHSRILLARRLSPRAAGPVSPVTQAGGSLLMFTDSGRTFLSRSG